MLKRTYEGQICSVAEALEQIGERWTILIIRDAFLGVRRFDDFQDSLGIARNVLNDRLKRLCEAGIMEKRPYQEKPPRYEYRLTQKGIDLWPVVMTLMKWGDRNLPADRKPPVVVEHKGCGGKVDDYLTCTKCGKRLTAYDTTPKLGKGVSRKVEPKQPFLKRRRRSKVAS